AARQRPRSNPAQTRSPATMHTRARTTSASKRLQVIQERVAVRRVHADEALAARARLAAMPEDGLDQCARAAVVEQVAMPAHAGMEAESPERRRAPFRTGHGAIRDGLREPL